ncbi:hypothetical protein SO802_023184 [Lithocarpus litseifolius]|uniref:Isopenicillin N synthase-like Fe(2+) 2OG dioxygenase domain-containing protein n=1 Tax=Lithocarpus litseifolius TaxID=425828 RepID=A0AAW2C5J5_9ROSI
MTHELMWARSSLCCLPRTRQAYILRTPSKVVDTSIDYDSEKVHSWRDTLRHPCHPLEEHMQFWPEKPPHYREVVGNHAAEVRKLSLWVLDLICEGLGLESRYLREELSQVQLMAINHYPPCPDPSQTLGLPKHSDVNLITSLLRGESHGLQVLKVKRRTMACN